MATDPCPQQDQLSAYAFGTLDESHARGVAEHVEHCPACDRTLQRLDREEDTIITQLRAPSTADPFLSETGFQTRLPVLESMAGDPALLLSGGSAEAPPAREELPELREYRLLEKLGEGGMGAVYKALHTRLDKVVAVKVLPRGRLKDPAVVARFEREMKVIGRLEHPNVIRAHDAGEADGVHFLVMEHLDGADLARVADRFGRLPIADACELVRQAALGLEYAHQQGLVHRDVKPSNLMLTSEGEVKVLDLGLARLSDRDVPAGAELTTTGQMMGTFDYMAPEQGSDTHKVDIRADIYSLGATLYRLLCGAAPFAGESFNTPMKKMLALATREPEPLIERRPDVPSALAALIGRMLAKSPADRPATPRDVAVALAPFTAGHDLKGLAAQVPGSTPLSFGPAQPLQKTEAYASVTQRDTTRRKPATAENGPRSGRRRWVMTATAAGVTALVLAAITVYRIQTSEGTIVVKLDEADKAEVEAKLKDGGVQIVDLTKEQSYLITPARSKGVPPGKYSVRAGAEGLHLSVKDESGAEMTTDEFTIRRGGKLVVHVSLTAPSAAPAETAKTTSAPEPDLPDSGKETANLPPDYDRERQAAEWVLSLGGGVNVMTKDNKLFYVWVAPAVLPTAPFTVRGVYLNGLRTKTNDDGLANLDGLRAIDSFSMVNGGELTAEGVRRLATLKTLRSISLHGHSIGDGGLEPLAALPDLESLSLQQVQLTDAGIPKLAKCRNLRMLCVGRDRVTDAGCEAIAQLSQLESVGIGPAEVTSAGIEHLLRLPRLNSLFLVSLSITDADLERIGTKKELTAISFTSVPVTDTGLKSFESLENLTNLTLEGTSVTIEGAAALQKALPDCRIRWNETSRPMQEGTIDRRTAAWVVARGGEIVMSDTGTGEELRIKSPTELPVNAGGRKIRSVSLRNERLRSYDDDLRRFAQLPELQGLSLFRAGPFSATGMFHLAGLKNLKSLDLDSPIGDHGLDQLKGLTNLEELTLVGANITDAGLARLAGMKKLKTLQLGNNDITDEGAQFIAALPRLQNLDLQSTGISDRGLDQILLLPELTQLSLARTRITDVGVDALSAKTQLERLSLEGLPVSDDALAFLEALKKLRWLSLGDTDVTAEGVARLQRALPECKIDWVAN
jgi:serine/threonine protein kinase/Leucine-rich repeat (LRR) protein